MTKQDSDYIACGDFNIERVRTKIRKKKKDDPIDNLFKALQSKGLIVPDDIKNSPSNLSKTRHFDQIAHHRYDDSTISFVKGGVIDFMGAVYRGDKKIKYKLTDHLPMWAVFDVSKDKNPKFINP